MPKLIIIIVTFLIYSMSCITLSADENTRKKFVVGFAQDTMANDWRAAQVRELEQAFKKYPEIKFIYTDGKGRSAKQVRDLEDLALQKVDLILTSPGDSVIMTPVISKIYQSGIPVVLITRKIVNDNYTSLVAPDDMLIAKNAALFMSKKMKGKGNVVILKGLPTATTAIDRTEGFLQEIKNYPGMHVVATKNANYLRSDAIRAMEEVIEDKINFNAIFAQSDSMAVGARLALEKAGIDPAGIVLVGIDYIAEAQLAIKNGVQTASFVYPTCANETAEIVAKILNKKSVPRRVKVSSQIVTINNVDKIEPIF